MCCLSEHWCGNWCGVDAGVDDALAFLCFKIPPEIRLRLRLGLVMFGSGAASSGIVVGAGSARVVVGVVIGGVVMLVLSLLL